MKANYKKQKNGRILPRKMCYTPEQLAQYFNEEWEEKRGEVYAEVKADVANQVLAVMFTALHATFGFGKKRLQQLKDSTECHFSLMKEGSFWKEYSPLDCIEYMKKEFDIDFDAGDGGARKCYTENSQTK